VFDFLWPHELKHARLPCPSLFPRVCSNSCLLSQQYHPTISPSVSLFSSCPQSLPTSWSFSMSQHFTSGSQSIGASASALHQSTQWIFRVDFFFFFFRIDWFHLLTVRGTLNCQQHNLKASVLQQSLRPYTTHKNKLKILRLKA